ncbi:MAG: 50S ribosomal protein L18 [Lachnospiraceae bacterium]|nr:50S ribosomal protein L18 [Lachnospiraceae bacterium]
MVNKVKRNEVREKKHHRQRNRFMGTPDCPRLTVFRSDKHIYAQIIDDVARKTLCQASTLKNTSLAHTNDVEAAKFVGKTIAEAAIKLGISNVVFDRSGYIYHGKVQALADSAREAGLKF